MEEFGFDRMESMKYEFTVMQKKAEKECIDSYQPFKKKPWILGAKLKRNPSDYCKHLAWSETVYWDGSFYLKNFLQKFFGNFPLVLTSL